MRNCCYAPPLLSTATLFVLPPPFEREIVILLGVQSSNVLKPPSLNKGGNAYCE